MIRLVHVLSFALVAFAAGAVHAAEPAEIAALRVKAEKGNGLAQYNLGLAYAEGEIVAPDLAEAFVWLSLASSNGATGKALDQVLGNITDAQLAEGRRRLEDYRAAIASRTPTTSPAASHRSANRGFSLFSQGGPPAGTLPAPESTSTVTQPPRNPGSRDAAAVSAAGAGEIARLKTELAKANELVERQAATIAKLEEELRRRAPSAGSTPPVR
ncbi:MAG: Peptidoglycan-binding LysM [Verrucomicrobia bacterium]|nr:Peptidoglycan-binding LysM [Verrucomicrobiota bacterium]